MESRRNFLKKTLYTAPLILTVAVRPSFARGGYGGPNVGGPGGGGGGGGGGYDLGNDGVTVTVPESSNPGGGTNLGGSRSGGHKDPHDWWMFWRKL